MSSSVRALARRVPWLRELRHSFRRWVAWGQYRQDFVRFAALARSRPPRFSLSWQDRYPCLDDKTPQTVFDHHYIYHTAWAARIVAETRPDCHVDIASSLYFSGIVSAFVPVKFYDYRPADLRLSHLQSEHADLTQLPFASQSMASLSCMHVVEHVGLGRYGDPLDPDGDLKAMAELQRVLRPAGALLFVVPVGRPRIQFNAHRIYSYEQVVAAFSELQLRQFALITDAPGEGLIVGASPELAAAQRYGCGCFWFQRAEHAL